MKKQRNRYIEYSRDSFLSCTALGSLTIGNGVTSIGEGVFSGCSNLKTITFEGTVEEWKAITKGDYWNYGIAATEVVCSDGKVTL